MRVCAVLCSVNSFTDQLLDEEVQLAEGSAQGAGT
jgi:hypothetical protein